VDNLVHIATLSARIASPTLLGAVCPMKQHPQGASGFLPRGWTIYTEICTIIE